MKRPDIPDIVKATCKVYGVSEDFLQQKTRKREVLWGRQAAHFLARRLTRHDLAVIGREIGKLNHATVINSVKIVNNEYGVYDDRTEFIDAIKRELNNMGYSTEYVRRYVV